MNCKYCGFEKVVKNGKINRKQFYKCNGCGRKSINPNRFPKMRVQNQIIVNALDLYWEGLSVRKTQRQLKRLFGVKVDIATIWKWIIKYTQLVKEYVKTFAPELSREWHVDETVIKCDSQKMWYWDIIDQDTKFIVATSLSSERTIAEVIELFKEGLATSKKRPEKIFVDGMPAYPKGFTKVFYSRYKKDRVELIRKAGIDGRKSNSIIERFHSTLKDRLKPMRGLKDEEQSKILLDGWIIHYNFLRPHQSLDGKTPAQEAGIDIDPEEGWKGLIAQATAHETRSWKIVKKALSRKEAELSPILVKA